MYIPVGASLDKRGDKTQEQKGQAGQGQRETGLVFYKRKEETSRKMCGGLHMLKHVCLCS